MSLGDLLPNVPLPGPLAPLAPALDRVPGKQKAADKVNDVLVKDETVRLSELLRRNGWGTKNSRGNKRARGVIGCESHDDPEAYNNAPCGTGENAVGLMQVCTVHRGTKGIPKDKEKAVEYLKDPDNNVKVGRAIYRAQGWGAWECPVTERNEDPEIKVSKNSVTDAVADIADPLLAPLDELAKFFGLLTQADTWLRVGKVVLGFVLIGGGLFAFIAVAGKTAGKSKIGKAALSAVPAGKAANVAKAVT